MKIIHARRKHYIELHPTNAAEVEAMLLLTPEINDRMLWRLMDKIVQTKPPKTLPIFKIVPLRKDIEPMDYVPSSPAVQEAMMFIANKVGGLITWTLHQNNGNYFWRSTTLKKKFRLEKDAHYADALVDHDNVRVTAE